MTAWRLNYLESTKWFSSCSSLEGRLPRWGPRYGLSAENQSSLCSRTEAPGGFSDIAASDGDGPGRFREGRRAEGRNGSSCMMEMGLNWCPPEPAESVLVPQRACPRLGGGMSAWASSCSLEARPSSQEGLGGRTLALVTPPEAITTGHPLSPFWARFMGTGKWVF